MRGRDSHAGRRRSFLERRKGVFLGEGRGLRAKWMDRESSGRPGKSEGGWVGYAGGKDWSAERTKHGKREAGVHRVVSRQKEKSVKTLQEPFPHRDKSRRCQGKKR